MQADLLSRASRWRLQLRSVAPWRLTSPLSKQTDNWYWHWYILPLARVKGKSPALVVLRDAGLS